MNSSHRETPGQQLNELVEELSALEERELSSLEQEVEKLWSVWRIKNLRGQAAIFHDDQHIGEKRRELHALKHPSVDVEAIKAFRAKPVVDNLEGNSLIHPLATPIIEVREDCTAARAVWWSLGVEGLSKFREPPMALVSLGMVTGAHVVEDGEWKILAGTWQRTAKAEYRAGWVRSMEPTNTRPPLTPEQDRNLLGRYAYRKGEVRRPVPEPPRPDTWQVFPDETSLEWLNINLGDRERNA